jgi:hypothetical protein
MFKYLQNYVINKFKNHKWSYIKYWFKCKDSKIKCNIWWDCNFKISILKVSKNYSATGTAGHQVLLLCSGPPSRRLGRWDTWSCSTTTKPSPLSWEKCRPQIRAFLAANNFSADYWHIMSLVLISMPGFKKGVLDFVRNENSRLP